MESQSLAQVMGVRGVKPPGGVKGQSPLRFLNHQKPGAILLLQQFQRVMALVGRRSGYIAQRVLAFQPHQQDLAGLDRVQGEACAYIGHRAGFGCYIYGFVMRWEDG
jgi:hypothetical protein